jgi:hypothetical protein
MRYSVLNKVSERRIFDPKNKKDLRELKHYMEKAKWKNGCPFYLEYPWEEIPVMCLQKYTSMMLAKLK